MDYVITNSSRKTFIKLDSSGKAVTCVKSAAQKFSDQKARNILSNLPKTLKKFHFTMVPMPNEPIKEIEAKCEIKVVDKTTIKKDDYELSNEIIDWLNRVELCSNLIVDESSRKDELFEKLSNADKDLSNCLHEIELSNWKSGCEGYKEYKKIKTILEKRRIIKDELSVVQSISTCDINIEQIEKLIERLKNREFAIRDVADYAI